MTYTLIAIILFCGESVTTIHHDFKSKKACEDARALVMSSEKAWPSKFCGKAIESGCIKNISSDER